MPWSVSLGRFLRAQGKMVMTFGAGAGHGVLGVAVGVVEFGDATGNCILSAASKLRSRHSSVSLS